MRQPPLVALTTDFGSASSYVAQLKAVLHASLPDVRIVDVSHDITPHSILHAEVVLRAAAFAFPLGTVHLVVVDPGVGTERRPIAVSSRGLSFVGPDNGVLGVALLQPGCEVVVLDKPSLFRSPVAPTFAGRDLFAPVAAEIAAGVPLSMLGTSIGDAQPTTLPAPVVDGKRVLGVGLMADTFGNITSNIPGALISGQHRVRVAGRLARWVQTYDQGRAGELLALIGSDGFLEIALRQASAARELGGGGGLEIVCEPLRQED